MSEKIMVSIDCITYNQEEYIAEAIESFLMQKTNFNYEILIHDDASTDNTREIIKKYEEKYPDIIKPIYQSENKYSKGIRVEYEYNFKRAKGKYIARCEGDDYWTDPYKLQKQVDYMEAHPECTLCMHSVDLICGKTKKNTGVTSPYNCSTKAPIEDMIMGGGGFIETSSVLYPRKAFENVPKLYFDCVVGDYPMQILLAHEGYAYYINESMSVYRTNAKNSWTRRMNDGHIEKRIKVFDNINIMLDEFNVYTNEKYNDTIHEAKRKNDFNKILIKNDLRLMKSPEFKDLYLNINIRNRINIIAKYYFPILKDIVNVLRSRFIYD